MHHEEALERDREIRGLQAVPALVREVSSPSHWGAVGFR
jgi:hypothetical protein